MTATNIHPAWTGEPVVVSTRTGSAASMIPSPVRVIRLDRNTVR
ncbi:hypothetical protein [Nocardia sp. X0981]